MWWDIVKSSRNEAYSNFLEQFGPGTNPEDWKIFETLISAGGWVLGLGIKGDVLLGSVEEYKAHRDFVLGMFEEEYPERYQEIVNTLKGLENKVVSSRPYDLPTYQNIVNLIGEKIRDLGLLYDTDYATVHDMPFTAVLEMAINELKNLDWPPPGSPLPRTDTRIKMFDAVLDEFIRVYTLLQRNKLSYRTAAEMNTTVAYRRRALRQLLENSFIVAYARIAPREPNSQFISQVLSIIEDEMNPSGE